MATEKQIYDRELKGMKEAYQKRNNWEDVVSSGYFNSDEYSSMEAFIGYVEEVYHTKVTDAKQLLKLTGITEETLKTETNVEPGNEITLDQIIIKACYTRYTTALETALQEGAKYKDLLQIKPKDYGLSETWSGCLSSDQYSSILWAIKMEFLLDEPGDLIFLPNLRKVAEDLEAPYSVMMDVYNTENYKKSK